MSFCLTQHSWSNPWTFLPGDLQTPPLHQTRPSFRVLYCQEYTSPSGYRQHNCNMIFVFYIIYHKISNSTAQYGIAYLHSKTPKVFKKSRRPHSSLTTLSERRLKLCLHFAKKCLKTQEMKQMFPLNLNEEASNKRFREKFKVDSSRTDRHMNSAIPYMQRLLNKYANKWLLFLV